MAKSGASKGAKKINAFNDGKLDGVNIAKNKDPGNFYRRKAKMDADNDMSATPYDPKEGKKRGKKLLDDLLDGV